MDAEERGYERSPSLQAYAQAIIEAFPDVFDHLVDAEIGYLFTTQEITMRGQRKAGFVTQPNAQGQDRYIYPWALKMAFGFVPDLLVVIDHQVCEVRYPDRPEKREYIKAILRNMPFKVEVVSPESLFLVTIPRVQNAKSLMKEIVNAWERSPGVAIPLIVKTDDVDISVVENAGLKKALTDAKEAVNVLKHLIDLCETVVPWVLRRHEEMEANPVVKNVAEEIMEQVKRYRGETA